VYDSKEKLISLCIRVRPLVILSREVENKIRDGISIITLLLHIPISFLATKKEIHIKKEKV